MDVDEIKNQWVKRYTEYLRGERDYCFYEPRIKDPKWACHFLLNCLKTQYKREEKERNNCQIHKVVKIHRKMIKESKESKNNQ